MDAGVLVLWITEIRFDDSDTLHTSTPPSQPWRDCVGTGPSGPFPATAAAQGRLTKGGPAPARGKGVRPLQHLPIAATLQAHHFPKPRGSEMACCHDDFLPLQAFYQGPPRLPCHLWIHVSA